MSLLLSICIPTRNQPDAIRRLLDNFMSEIVDEIEIIISDGSDDFESKNLIVRYLDKLPIRYIKRIGFSIDEGMVELIEASNGKYIWFLGDDEIKNDSILKIINIIKFNKEIKYIFINANNMRKKIDSVKITDNNYFIERNELLLAAGSGLAFISSSIIISSLAKKSLNYASKYKGTDFVNFAIVMFVIANSNNHYFIEEVLIKSYPHTSEEIKRRVTKSDGLIINNFFEIFGLTWKRIITDFKISFYHESLNEINRELFNSSWKGVIVGYIGEWDSPKGKRLALIKEFYKYPEAWFALILFCMPRQMLFYLYEYYKKIKFLKK
jgi:glycosyltransferase involved in cell wall biosynthesis